MGFVKEGLIGAVAAMAALLGGPGQAQDASFGSPADQDYAAAIWAAMVDAKLAGDGMIRSFPYQGVVPHGMLLETFYTTATVEGHTGTLVVKRNFGPEGVSVDEVLNAPADHIGSVTVMFQREEGYDSETNDWFYVKYLPDGSLDKNPAGLALAGLVGKNADAGCIACHQGDPDYLFTTDAALEGMRVAR